VEEKVAMEVGINSREGTPARSNSTKPTACQHQWRVAMLARLELSTPNLLAINIEVFVRLFFLFFFPLVAD
jgi:hypothetical protein